MNIGHKAKAIAFAKSSLWIKNQNSRKHFKIHSTNHLELFRAKNRSKNHQIFEKWDHFENRPSCKGYIAFAKSSLWVKNVDSKKLHKIHSTNHLELFCAKKHSKKTPNIREMRPFWKSAIMQRLYSLCKILTLGKKCGFQKTSQNPFYKPFRVVLCKKTARKTTKYSRNETILKIGHHAKAI